MEIEVGKYISLNTKKGYFEGEVTYFDNKIITLFNKEKGEVEISLKDLLKREDKCCQYCELSYYRDENKSLFSGLYDELFIEDNKMKFISNNKELSVNINYCPICGRKLG